MQKRTLCAFVLLLVLTSVAAWAADVTGTWTGSIPGPNGDFSLTYVFKQAGDKLTGTLSGPTDPLPIADGKVDGDKISFSVTVDMGGNAVKSSMKGTIKGEEIIISTTNDAGMDMGGDMTIKRQK